MNLERKLDNFIKAWSNKGSEVADKVTYWNELLGILGVPESELADGSYIEYEKKINWKSNKFHGAIDGYIPKTKVLIEQKSFGVDLSKPESRPNGGDKELITPFQQAKRYDDNLPADEKADYYVLSNFSEIWIYDIRKSLDVKPVKVKLSELKKQLHVLDFLVKKDITNEPLEKEKEVSLAAGELVSKMYNELANIFEQYKDIDSKEAQRSINTLCVRLVFCLYAEDAGLFEDNQFHDYLLPIAPNRMGIALKKLFEILDVKERDRTKKDPFFNTDNPELAKFPYVNGGMFHDQSIIIPPFTPELKDILLNKASRGFDWSDISPTIFGAVFESTLNPETRRQGGMHYTSVENIHKVIDPLFLDDLKAELRKIKDTYVQPAALKEHARKFQEKLANLTFLDPACGSGNFLTETYLSLRKLENEAIRIETNGESLLETGEEADKYIKVSIQQFFGIEINDFAVSVAKTALWIAEDQMMKQTQDLIYGAKWHFLPLQTYTHIHEGNALRMDWDKVIPNYACSYIISNPPFVGYGLQTRDQKEDIRKIYLDNNGKAYKQAGKIDYVAGWFYKASKYIYKTQCRIAFVSTNSITQGDQVNMIWQPLYSLFKIALDFAYQSFKWNSETTASMQAQVDVVIIGFSYHGIGKPKLIFSKNNVKKVREINPYLIEAPTVFLPTRRKPICKVQEMTTGSRPTDHGNFIFKPKEKQIFLQKQPNAKKWFRILMGSHEFLHGQKRYCLWLKGITPKELKAMPLVMKCVEAVKKFRMNSSKKATQRSAATPWLFQEIREQRCNYLLIPGHTSGRRVYIPMGYISPQIIPTNADIILPNATLYSFGILESIVHMSWMRITAGRLGTSYRYSKNIVYNDFPWPTSTKVQKQKIEQTAQEILNARKAYPDSSLADLYDPDIMPPELLKAHKANDKAVMQAYGFESDMTESEIVAELFKMYEKLIQKDESKTK